MFDFHVVWEHDQYEAGDGVGNSFWSSKYAIDLCVLTCVHVWLLIELPDQNYS